MLADLEKYKTAQRTAYSCVEATAKKLKPGMTEVEAAGLLRDELHGRGITDYLHTPLAWFGERTGFLNMRGFRDYLPSQRKLTESDLVILDCSPLVDGHIGDVAITTSLTPRPELERCKASLRRARAKLPELFLSSLSLGEIWKEVEKLLAEDGFQNAYQRYPFSVLGHRVPPIAARRKFRSYFPFSYLSWFGHTAYVMFATKGISTQLIRRGSKQSKVGVWAIEPHLAGDGYGAKFEEILVVEEGKAWWLDDDVPHMRA